MSGSVLTIESFWKTIIPPLMPDSANLVKPLGGWHETAEKLATFTEAPLRLADYSGERTSDFKILLVSAPGAVGKDYVSQTDMLRNERVVYQSRGNRCRGK